MDDEILDQGLRLALAFGPDWRQPIQARLAALRPELGPEVLDRYDACCRDVRDRTQARAHELLALGGDLDAVFGNWARETRAAHPWISEDNLRHLWSQACYYMYK